MKINIKSLVANVAPRLAGPSNFPAGRLLACVESVATSASAVWLNIRAQNSIENAVKKASSTLRVVPGDPTAFASAFEIRDALDQLAPGAGKRFLEAFEATVRLFPALQGGDADAEAKFLGAVSDMVDAMNEATGVPFYAPFAWNQGKNGAWYLNLAKVDGKTVLEQAPCHEDADDDSPAPAPGRRARVATVRR